MFALITSVLAILLIAVREFFDWKRRAREANEAEQKEIALEQKVIDNVIDRLGHLAKKENATVSDIENKVDEELDRLGKDRTP